MIRCPKCGRSLDKASFCADKHTCSGLSCWCKECRKTKNRRWYNEHKEFANAKARRYHETHTETQNENARRYHATHREECREMNLAYRKKKREQFRLRSNNYYATHCAEILHKNKVYRVLHHAELYARGVLLRAVRKGDVVRPCTCSLCGIECVPDGHHEDYSKPLDVIWVCKTCHRRLDSALVSGAH
jgi:hypothetical protein